MASQSIRGRSLLIACSTMVVLLCYTLAAQAQVVITEVVVSTPGIDAEFVELMNISDEPVDLDGWGLGDAEEKGESEEGMLRFPERQVLEPGEVLVVAIEGDRFYEYFGQIARVAVYGYADFRLLNNHPFWPASGVVRLANLSDEILLIDYAGRVVDALSWGLSTEVYDPPLPRPVVGTSFVRTDPHAPGADASAWEVSDAPTPGEVPSFCGAQVCGNGDIEEPEACDDGNTASGDGCSSTCQIEEGWHCDHPQVACDGVAASVSHCSDTRVACRDVMLTEIYAYDGWPVCQQWIEIYNAGDEIADLHALLLYDDQPPPSGGEGRIRFPRGSILPPGRRAVVAYGYRGYEEGFRGEGFCGRRGDIGFSGTFDVPAGVPLFESQNTTSSIPTMEYVAGVPNSGLLLAPEGEEIGLVCATGDLVDSVAYRRTQSLITWPGFWIGEPVQLHTDDVEPPWRDAKAVVERYSDRPEDDTNSAQDWLLQRCPTPGRPREVAGEPPLANDLVVRVEVDDDAQTISLPISDADGDELYVVWTDSPNAEGAPTLNDDDPWDAALRIEPPFEPGVYDFDYLVADTCFDSAVATLTVRIARPAFCFVDGDGDGYGDANDSGVERPDGCLEGEVERGGDCDDSDESVYPGAFEYCDGLDNDCDAETPDGNDEAGFGQQCTVGQGRCERSGERICDGAAIRCDADPGEPAASDATCDGLDDDCDGEIDEDFVRTTTNCGQGLCADEGRTLCVRGDVLDTCEPGAAGVENASAGTCGDGIDNDCDGEIDEAVDCDAEDDATPTEPDVGPEHGGDVAVVSGGAHFGCASVSRQHRSLGLLLIAAGALLLRWRRRRS